MAESDRLLVRPEELEIPESEPFKKDLLSRKPFADMMAQLVSHTGDSLVLALDAPWGAGKSTFLRMWIQELKNQKTPCIYFNAWENDFAADPLVCLLGEVSALRSEINGKPSSKGKMEKVKKIGITLIKRTIPVAAKMLTAGALDEKTFKDLHEAVGGVAEKIAEDAIQDHEKGKQLGTEFRKALEEAVQGISKDESPEDERPLVFVINELDRCKPTFAIEVLERAKHFFAVPGVIFVLGIDKKALSTSLQTIYGTGFDSYSYLRRFIDLELSLPNADCQSFASALFTRFNLMRYSHFQQLESGGFPLYYWVSELFRSANLPLRAQEQVIARFGVVARLDLESLNLSASGAFTLLTLLASNPSLYEKLMEGALAGTEVIEQWTAGHKELDVFFRVDDFGSGCHAFLVYVGALMQQADLSLVAANYVPSQVKRSPGKTNIFQQFINRYGSDKRTFRNNFLRVLNLARSVQ